MTHVTEPVHIDDHAEQHPSREGTYFAVFIVLAVLTILELLATYIPGLKVPLLLGLMGSKAWLIAQFYMHLRYDSKVLTWAFLLPLAFGAAATILLQPLMVIPQ